jgi:hypothetical protein
VRSGFPRTFCRWIAFGLERRTTIAAPMHIAAVGRTVLALIQRRILFGCGQDVVELRSREIRPVDGERYWLTTERAIIIGELHD